METIRTFLSNIDARKAAYILFGILAGSVVIFIIATGGSGDKVDSYPIEGSDQDYATRARIINSEDLFKTLGGDRRYDSLSEDLHVFARTAYAVYKVDSPPVIGFVIDGKIKKDASTVTFSGAYGSVENKVDVTVMVLENDRLTTSITDSKTDLNIDSKLPSNTKLNKFIASLPRDFDTFTAEYIRSDDKVSVFINERDPNLLSPAFDQIKTEVDDGSFDQNRFQVIYPIGSIGQ